MKCRWLRASSLAQSAENCARTDCRTSSSCRARQGRVRQGRAEQSVRHWCVLEKTTAAGSPGPHASTCAQGISGAHPPCRPRLPPQSACTPAHTAHPGPAGQVNTEPAEARVTHAQLAAKGGMCLWKCLARLPASSSGTGRSKEQLRGVPAAASCRPAPPWCAWYQGGAPRCAHHCQTCRDGADTCDAGRETQGKVRHI